MESSSGPARESFFVNVSPNSTILPTFCFDSLDLATTRRTLELLKTWAKPSQVSTLWITKFQVKTIFILRTLSQNWGKISKPQPKCFVKIRRKKISCKQVTRKNRTPKIACLSLQQTSGVATRAEAFSSPNTTSVKSKRKHPTQR